MITIVKKQLEIVENNNVWIKNSLEGNKEKDAHNNIVNLRRKLNKKKDALEGNPAAALYGESQAGKSYLASALLSEVGDTFKIFDGNGVEYDFKKDINPRGNEMESTSVVTRFSTNYKWIDSSYPIIAKLLSPTDIILVICEAYYNNLDVNNPLSYKDLSDQLNLIDSKFSEINECQKLIIEDDVKNIEEYFEENFSRLKYINIVDVGFFEKISSIVTSIEPEEWKNVFSLLWNNNLQLTELFDDLMLHHKKLNFVETIYLPIDAVLRSKGTLLDVDRIDEIYGDYTGEEKDYSATTSVLFIEKGGNKTTQTFSKPYLCALISELIFVLPEKYKKTKIFLEKTDLLDFPGSRAYEATNEDKIPHKSLSILLRRGRVDYLFNKYSNNERINILLFCQNHKMSKQNVVSKKLNYWIGNIIGKTPFERQNFKSSISPLFIISTWFNKDMEYDSQNDKPNQMQTLNEKWEQRFKKVLKNEIIKAHENSWFENWTNSNKYFNNIFLLRDFEKSGENVKDASNIYKGFNDTQSFRKEIEELIPFEYPDFRSILRKSFIEYDFVKNHFTNPEESWDEAASINKDGTKLIINKLTIAANNINPARMSKMIAELNEITQNMLDEMLKHFHSNDKDEELQKAKNMAGDIQFKLATSFSADKIKYFGQMMKELMIDESTVIELFRKKVDDFEHRDMINMDIYSTYRIEVPVMEKDTVDSYFKRLCVRYEKNTEERIEDFHKELEEKQIDLEILIRGNHDLIKNNAQQLADALIEYWLEYISLSDKKVIQQIFSQDSTLDHIKEMYLKLFKKLKISKQIAEKIRRYMNGNNKTDLPYEIVSDIAAEMLNKCVNTVGFEYLIESDLNDLKQANDENGLGLVLNYKKNSTENTVEELFTKLENQIEIMTSHPENMESLPSYRNYLNWSNRLKVGFVSVCDIPNYDVNANSNLGRIIDECKNIKYE